MVHYLHGMNSIENLPLRLWRVYSKFRPSVVARVWAHDATEAVLKARESYPLLYRLNDVKGFPA